MGRLARTVFGACAIALLSYAAAQAPTEGTEVMVTDTAGHQLVGYGVVKSGLLMLRLGGSGDKLLLLLVSPDGSVQSLRGVRGAGGALLVDLPDGTRESLGAYLGRNDVALRIVPQKGGSSSASAASSGGGESGSSDHSSESSSDSSGSSDSSSGSEDVSVGVDVGTDGN